MKMTGRRALIELLRLQGVERIFGNPGTTELPLIDELLSAPDIHYVLALQEAAAMAMADGYAQASGKVGVLSLHAAPGLGNAMGMLYDSKRAGTPIVILAGQHEQSFTLGEPLLWQDLPSLARPLVKWAEEVRSLADLPRAMHRAFKTALAPPQGPVFLSIPGDVLMAEGEVQLGSPTRIAPRSRGDAEAVARAAEFLAQAKNPVLISGGRVARSDALGEVVALADLLGAPVYVDTIQSRASFPTSHPLFAGTLGRLPPGIRAKLEAHDVLFSICGDLFTLSLPSETEAMPGGLKVLHLDEDGWELGKNYPEDVAILGDAKATLPEITAAVLARLGPGQLKDIEARRQVTLEAIGASRRKLAHTAAPAASGPIQASSLLALLGRILPADAVVVEESLSSTGRIREQIASDDPASFFSMHGGGIGWGISAAVGVKIASPERPVVAVIGDGSALYTCQALWSAAHENLGGLVFLILNNGGYRILKQRVRDMIGASHSNRYLAMDIEDPPVGFVDLARGFGVEAHRLQTLPLVVAALRKALSADGPVLLDIEIDPSF